MPRPPKLSPSIEAIPSAIYSSVASRAAASGKPVIPLHVGDTWMEAPEGCRMQDLHVADWEGLHRYAPVAGIPELRQAIADERTDLGVPTATDQVLVAAGATGGLGALAGALLAPGEEVLITAPYWPLIEGIVRSFHGTPVPVPFLDVDGPEAAVEAMRERVTPGTVAMYLNTPGNPSGQVMPEPWLAALAELARELDLWLMTDEVYEDCLFEGTHVPARPLAPERTVSAHSFSKRFGMAGNRCGYLVGPTEVLDAAKKVSTHTFYATPTSSQVAALRALQGPGEAWATQARERYKEVAHAVAKRLQVPAPQGGTFFFLDVAHALDARGLGGFLEDCADEGVLVAPGPRFGPYPHHIRFCFTSAPPDRIMAGVEVLAKRLGR